MNALQIKYFTLTVQELKEFCVSVVHIYTPIQTVGTNMLQFCENNPLVWTLFEKAW